MDFGKMQEMLTQATEMRDRMQHKMSTTVVEGSSGGGAVSVTMNGQKQALKVKIDRAAVMGLSAGTAADAEMLEDLVVAAINDAGRRIDQALETNVNGMLGGMDLGALGLK